MLKSLLKRYLSLTLALLVPLMILTVVAFAATTTGSGNGTIAENLLDYSYTWTLVGDEGQALSTKLDPAGETDTCTGTVTSAPAAAGGNDVTMTARTSAFYTEGEGCDAKNYYAASMTLIVTIKNTSNSALKLTALSNSEPSAIISAHQGDVIGVGGSFIVKIQANRTAEDSETSSAITNVLTIKTEEVNVAELTAVPSMYAGYTFTTTDGEKIVVDKNASSAVTKEYSVMTEITLALTDDLPEGYELYGWRLSTGEILNGNVLTLKGPTILYPLILPAGQELTSNTSGHFQVGSTYYQYWEDAMLAADMGTDKIVKLAQDYTLPGTLLDSAVIPGYGGQYVKPTEDGGVNYIVPMDVTLLIPFDEAGTCYTKTPETIYGSHPSPSPYRTLTMADGTSITVEADSAISVSAQVSSVGQNADSWNGTPAGPYGKIMMEENSKITLESNSNLYAWGYIAGDGTVVATPGSTVYECFQIRNWRGGSATLSMASAEQRVFPVSQYYVQNVEAKLQMEAGSSEVVFAAPNMSGSSWPASATFIGDGGMFDNSGTITKQYIPETDQLQIDVTGDISIAPITLDLGVATLASGDFVLPVNSNIVIHLKSGTASIKQDLALLPGAELKIDQGAVLNIEKDKNIFVYDQDQWDQNYATATTKLVVVGYSTVNGSTTKRTEADLIDVTVDVNGTVIANGGFYTTAGGANIISSENTGKIVFNNASTNVLTYQATQSGTSMTYHDIPVTSAELHNGERYAGTAYEYTETAGATGGTAYSYCAECDKWYTGAHSHAAQIVNGAKAGAYETLAEALTLYDAGTKSENAADDKGLPYIQLLADSTEPGFAIDKDLYLDLNGHTVTLTSELTINEGATLYGMDSTTDGYEYGETYGRIKGYVSGKVAVAHETYRLAGGKVRRYVSYRNENELSFHRYNMSVTSYEFHFRANGQCDMDFGATFRGSSTVVQLLKDMGFKVVESNIVRPGWWSEQYPNRSASQEIGEYPDRSEENPYILRGTLINIGADQPSEFTKYYDIYALLKFQDNTVVESVPRNLNYLWALKQYYNSSDATEDEKAVIDAFLEKNGLQTAWNSIN